MMQGPMKVRWSFSSGTPVVNSKLFLTQWDIISRNCVTAENRHEQKRNFAIQSALCSSNGKKNGVYGILFVSVECKKNKV